ncbi:MAG: hypothetical protein IT292_10675 [Deltaproteobacteria bacterium]|nr:hypothetical protein [Deltaproteobacteria bacterium]
MEAIDRHLALSWESFFRVFTQVKGNCTQVTSDQFVELLQSFQSVVTTFEHGPTQTQIANMLSALGAKIAKLAVQLVHNEPHSLLCCRAGMDLFICAQHCQLQAARIYGDQGHHKEQDEAYFALLGSIGSAQVAALKLART